MALKRFSECIVAFAAVLVSVQGQPAGSPPRSPDLVGIYPGMPANQARAILQKRSSAISVREMGLAETGFSLTIPDPGIQDQIDVFLTQAPNDPAVWMIKRSQSISP